MSRQLLFKSAETQVIDLDETKGIVKGRASVFGNVDSDGDVMVKGAYAKSIKENLHRIKYLYQHDFYKPIGKFSELVETMASLDFVSELAVKASLARDVMEMIKAGVITENSVGFIPIKEEFNKEKGVNYIKEAKLYEISAVTLAANPLATIESFKGDDVSKAEMVNKYLEERFGALEKLVKSNISDELGLAVEFEIKSLKELSLREITTEPSNLAHSADEQDNEEEQISAVYKFLKENL